MQDLKWLTAPIRSGWVTERVSVRKRRRGARASGSAHDHGIKNARWDGIGIGFTPTPPPPHMDAAPRLYVALNQLRWFYCCTWQLTMSPWKLHLFTRQLSANDDGGGKAYGPKRGNYQECVCDSLKEFSFHVISQSAPMFTSQNTKPPALLHRSSKRCSAI